MDGTSIVAAFIIITFFATYPGYHPPQDTTPTSSGDRYNTPITREAPRTEVIANTTQPPASQEKIYIYVDNSPAAYRYIEYDRMDKIIRKYNKDMPQPEVDRIKIAVNRYCKEKDIDPRLALALMARESAFNPEAVSPSGAIGLGQILPMNYESLGITDPSDIDQNVRGAIYYLKEKLNDWQGNQNQLGLALASYLRGTGAIKRDGATYSGHTEVYVNDILRLRAEI